MDESFLKLSKHSQAWLISLIASWDNFGICSELLLEYIGVPRKFNLVQKPNDTFFIAQYEDMNIVGSDGTKNLLEWITNFDGVPLGKKFHPGLDRSVRTHFVKYIKDIDNKDIYTLSAGQSNGGAESLLRNYYLRKHEFKDVESFGFASPYIATSDGIKELKKYGIRHTGWYTDCWSDIPSDPTDDVGVLGGKHYGESIIIEGSGSISDHSYLNITYKMIATFLEWSVNDKRYGYDAMFWSKLVRSIEGKRLIKK